MKRQSVRRYLRPQKLTKRSKDFYVFDTETGILKDGKIEYILSARPEHLIFGVVYGKEGYTVINTVNDFIKEFKKRKYKNKIVYAHNAEYDLSAIYGNIFELDRSALFNGKFISCTNGNCKFADSYNLLPTSVKELGIKLGLHKKELGQNLKSSVRNLKQDVDYCVRDCEIVYKSLQKIFKDLEPSFTIGSLSLKLFRSKYLKKTIKINEHSDKFFSCLYGGRTEAFKIGKCNAFVYDINSAYPKVMRDNYFPHPSRLKVTNDCETLEQFDEFEGMITATVTVPHECKYPVLPVKTDSRLIFPVGTFTGSWTLPEFRYAVKVNKIKFKIHEVVYSERIHSPFFEFINDNWELRTATKDEFEKFYYKLFMNNLYGKLIQRAQDEYRYCKNIKEARVYLTEKKIRKAEFIRVQGGYFLRYDVDKIFAHTIACWGTYITAYVRIMLHQFGNKHFDKLIYCDTDSNAIEKDLPINSKELGGWKKEKKKIKEIRALKDYVYEYFDETLKKTVTAQMLKGVKKNAKQMDEFANVFVTKRMVKTKESFRRVDNIPPGTFIEQTKVMTGDYKKRTVLKDGTTKPFIL